MMNEQRRINVGLNERHAALLMRLGDVLRLPKRTPGSMVTHLVARLLDRRPDIAAEVLAPSAEELQDAVEITRQQ